MASTIITHDPYSKGSSSELAVDVLIKWVVEDEALPMNPPVAVIDPVLETLGVNKHAAPYGLLIDGLK